MTRMSGPFPLVLHRSPQGDWLTRFLFYICSFLMWSCPSAPAWCVWSLGFSEVNSGHVCWGAWAVPPWCLLRPSEAVMQTLPEAEQTGMKGTEHKFAGSQMEWRQKERCHSRNQNIIHTHHTPANNSSHSFQDHLSSNMAEKVTWISYNKRSKKKRRRRKETSCYNALGQLNIFSASSSKKPVLPSEWPHTAGISKPPSPLFAFFIWADGRNIGHSLMTDEMIEAQRSYVINYQDRKLIPGKIGPWTPLL